LAAYAVTLSALLFQLERRHPTLWTEMGSPSWFFWPNVESLALLKLLFAGWRSGELHATVRYLVTGARLSLVLSAFLFLLLGLQQCSGPGPEG
jgi:hypothetical protein